MTRTKYPIQIGIVSQIIGCHRNTAGRKVKQGSLTIAELKRIIKTIGLTDEEILKIIKE